MLTSAWVRSWILLGLSLVATTAVADDDEQLQLETAPLVRMAQRHGVPMPPKGERLVYARVATQPEVYSPAFLLEERPGGTIVVLRGFRRETIFQDGQQAPPFYPFAATADALQHLRIKVDFHRTTTFLAAIQSAARGDDASAQFLWRQLNDADRWSDIPEAEEADTDKYEPRRFLGRCLLNRWSMDVLTIGSDWREINRKCVSLLKDIPELACDVRRRPFIGLLAAMSAQAPQPGSTEELFMKWASLADGDGLFIFRQSDERYDARFNALARKIVRQGFDVVPTLLSLVGDQRFTAQTDRESGQNPIDGILRVGDLANQLLGEITGQSETRDADDVRPALTAWWNKVRNQNEADVFAASVFQREEQKITAVNEGPAQILAAKYPTRLPALLAEVLERRDDLNGVGFLVDAIADSTLPRELKVRVLTDALQKSSPEVRQILLSALARASPQKCADLLVRLLRSQPRDSTDPPQAEWILMDLECDDVRPWQELLRLARRSTVELRLPILEPMDYGDAREKNRERRQAFLTAFLNDAEVRRLPQGNKLENGAFQGHPPAGRFREIAVRDLAAMELACLLNLCDAPQPNWTAAQWAALRGKVKARLAQENLPNLEASGANRLK